MAPEELPPNENRGPIIVGMVWTFTILDILIVALRFYDRVRLRGKVWWDDWTILAACIVTTFGSACNSVMVEHGWGRHIEYLSPHQLSVGLEWVTFAQLQAYLAIYLVKLSVCFFTLRLLLGGIHTIISRLIYFLMLFLTIIMIVPFFLLCVSCVPLKGLWTLDPAFHKKCLPQQLQTTVTRVYGVLCIITDFACALIPISIIRSLRISKRTKATICLIISLGLLTAACSIGRTVTTTFDTEDVTWKYTPVLVWAGLETNLGIIVASMPALRQLSRDFLRSSMKSFSSPGASNKHNLVNLEPIKSASHNAARTTKGAAKGWDSDGDTLVDDGVPWTRSFSIESGGASNTVKTTSLLPKNLRSPEYQV